MRYDQNVMLHPNHFLWRTGGAEFTHNLCYFLKSVYQTVRPTFHRCHEVCVKTGVVSQTRHFFLSPLSAFVLLSFCILLNQNVQPAQYKEKNERLSAHWNLQTPKCFKLMQHLDLRSLRQENNHVNKKQATYTDRQDRLTAALCEKTQSSAKKLNDHHGYR